MDEKKINWQQILVTALITGIITVISGLIVFKFQEHEPKLTYSAIETIPFEGSNKVVGIYNVVLENEGKKDLKDVVCVVKISKSQIDQYKVSVNPANIHSETQKDDTLTVKLSGLNPSEEVTVSILASSQSTLPKRPEVALRAVGLTGTEKSSNGKDGKFQDLLLTVAGGVLATLALLFTLSSKLKGRVLGSTVSKILPSEKHSGDQRNILAYLCNLFKLNEEEEKYRSLNYKVEYWSESDKLAMSAIESKSSDYSLKIDKLLRELTQYASMSDDSEAIVYYNIARVAAARGEHAIKDQYLKKASGIAPTIIAKRLDIDSFSKQLLEAKDRYAGRP
jgi:hypothetical protein